tara:strand:+ start:530 stop:904 length:375 start_codon:yes stop_codon:yes gene_type:complete
MIQNIDINKILDVALKYKLQLTFLGMLALLAGSFHLGKSSVSIALPKKSEYCQSYTDVIDELRIENSKLRKSATDKVRKAVDNERKLCNVRIDKTLEDCSTQADFSSCQVVRRFAEQCNQAGVQ